MTSGADPRISKTRHRLRQALIELMQTNKIENISVQTLTNQAGVTRGTFYLHYQDKQDFIQQTIQDILDDLFAHALIKVPRGALLATIKQPAELVTVFSLGQALAHIESLATVFQTLLVKQQEQDVSARLTTLLTEQAQAFYQSFHADFMTSEIPTDIQIAYYVSAVVGSILTWLSTDLKYTPHYLTKCLRALQPVHQPTKIGFTDFFTD